MLDATRNDWVRTLCLNSFALSFQCCSLFELIYFPFAAEERDKANADPRRDQIPLEIRKLEDKCDALKRQIEDETITLEALKQTANAQNALNVLREQIEKEFESLEEMIREESYSFTKFNIDVPTSLPRDGDDEGSQLSTVVKKIADGAREKHDTANAHYGSASEDAIRSQKIVSEKTALLTSSQRSLSQVKAKLQTASASVENIRKLVEALRKHEDKLGEVAVPDTVTEEAPREILQFISERMEALEEANLDANGPEIARKLFKKLKKLVRFQSFLRNTICLCLLRSANAISSFRPAGQKE